MTNGMGENDGLDLTVLFFASFVRNACRLFFVLFLIGIVARCFLVLLVFRTTFNQHSASQSPASIAKRCSKSDDAHQILGVALCLRELHLVHALASVPVQERPTLEHSHELCVRTLEDLLDGRRI